LRWLLRRSSRHGKRTTLLVDALAVRGAIAKGRSSAPTFRVPMRRIAAQVLAGDLAIKLVYVPTEQMPADKGSRGICYRKPLPGKKLKNVLVAARRRVGKLRSRPVGGMGDAHDKLADDLAIAKALLWATGDSDDAHLADLYESTLDGSYDGSWFGP